MSLLTFHTSMISLLLWLMGRFFFSHSWSETNSSCVSSELFLVCFNMECFREDFPMFLWCQSNDQKLIKTCSSSKWLPGTKVFSVWLLIQTGPLQPSDLQNVLNKLTLDSSGSDLVQLAGDVEIWWIYVVRFHVGIHQNRLTLNNQDTLVLQLWILNTHKTKFETKTTNRPLTGLTKHLRFSQPIGVAPGRGGDCEPVKWSSSWSGQGAEQNPGPSPHRDKLKNPSWCKNLHHPVVQNQSIKIELFSSQSDSVCTQTLTHSSKDSLM